MLQHHNLHHRLKNNNKNKFKKRSLKRKKKQWRRRLLKRNCKKREKVLQKVNTALEKLDAKLAELGERREQLVRDLEAKRQQVADAPLHPPLPSEEQLRDHEADAAGRAPRGRGRRPGRRAISWCQVRARPPGRTWSTSRSSRTTRSCCAQRSVGSRPGGSAFSPAALTPRQGS